MTDTPTDISPRDPHEVAEEMLDKYLAAHQELGEARNKLTKVFDAFERLAGRIHRDTPNDGSELPPPEDEFWATALDNLLTFTDELYGEVEAVIDGTIAAEPTLITTADQIRLLSIGTVLLDNGDFKFPRPWQILPRASRKVMTHTGDENEYDLADTERIVRLLGAYGPFRVLHTPGGDRG